MLRNWSAPQTTRRRRGEVRRDGQAPRYDDLFAALNIVTGQVKAGHYPRRRRREFLHFMNEIVASNPDRQIHVILDNLNTHKPKNDRWLKTHPNVRFHFIPTYSSWLNQVECWFHFEPVSIARGEFHFSAAMARCD